MIDFVPVKPNLYQLNLIHVNSQSINNHTISINNHTYKISVNNSSCFKSTDFCLISPLNSKSVVYMGGICADPDFRSRGFAKALFVEAVRALRPYAKYFALRTMNIAVVELMQHACCGKYSSGTLFWYIYVIFFVEKHVNSNQMYIITR